MWAAFEVAQVTASTWETSTGNTPSTPLLSKLSSVQWPSPVLQHASGEECRARTRKLSGRRPRSGVPHEHEGERQHRNWLASSGREKPVLIIPFFPISTDVWRPEQQHWCFTDFGRAWLQPNPSVVLQTKSLFSWTRAGATQVRNSTRSLLLVVVFPLSVLQVSMG